MYRTLTPKFVFYHEEGGIISLQNSETLIYQTTRRHLLLLLQALNFLND